MLPLPTARLRFRLMEMADLDDMTAVLSAPDSVRVGRHAKSREDAVRWIEWQERNYAEHDFGLWVVETHAGEFIGDCGLTMQDVEGTPHVEVGYHVMPAMRRLGHAIEAATAVRDCAAAAGRAPHRAHPPGQPALAGRGPQPRDDGGTHGLRARGRLARVRLSAHAGKLVVLTTDVRYGASAGR